MIKSVLTIFIIFLSGSILAQGIDLFEEYDPAEDTLEESISLVIREDLPKINFVVNNAFYMKALYPDYYVDDYRIQKDIRSVKKNDSALIASWDSLGVFVIAILEQLSGIEWKENRIDIHLLKYMRNRGLYDPLMIPFDGIKCRNYTEAAPTGILRSFSIIQLLAGRNLLQMSQPGQLGDLPAIHPLLDQTPYRFDVVALTLALACAQQLLPPDSLEMVMQSEFWKRHNPGWNIFENHFRYAWPLTYEQPLITFLALEDGQSPLLALTKPPRLKKPKIKNRPKAKVTQLAAGGGRLGFSVSRTARGYLRVVDIDTLGLAYSSGLMIDDQIKRVNSEYARNARELMGKILEQLDSEGVYLLVNRAGSEIGVLLLPAVEEIRLLKSALFFPYNLYCTSIFLTYQFCINIFAASFRSNGRLRLKKGERPDNNSKVGLFINGRGAKVIHYCKPLGIIFFLYLFILSITLLGSAFKLFGAGFAETLLQTTANPFVGLFIGILATSVIQSSSTTTSILVGMVAGGLISIEGAIPIVMGANIGTTITNTMVSLTHITRTREFSRAFSGAIVHDIFNVLVVIVLFPLQYFTNFLGRAAIIMETVLEGTGGLKFVSPISAVTKPVSNMIISLLGDSSWLSAMVAILLLFIALKFMVDIMKSLVLSRVEGFFSRYIFKTTFRALMLGILLTAVVQSSSITTSIIIPLIGAGVLSLRQIYPYTLGANMGTTVTAILAGLVTQNAAAVSVAMAHLLFNICGIAIFLPLASIPVGLAKRLSRLILKNRLIPIIFIFMLFFVIPISVIYLLR